MRFVDLALYLGGDTRAIRRLAADPWSLPVGALFVLIAGAAKRAVVEESADLPIHRLLEQTKAPVRILWSA